MRAGKKCHALPSPFYHGTQEGWLAEQHDDNGRAKSAGKIHYVAASIPLGVRQDQPLYDAAPRNHAGLENWTVGDDICWLNVGSEVVYGRAIRRPGYFGVLPAPILKTNSKRVQDRQHDHDFTNVALGPPLTSQGGKA